MINFILKIINVLFFWRKKNLLANTNGASVKQTLQLPKNCSGLLEEMYSAVNAGENKKQAELDIRDSVIEAEAKKLYLYVLNMIPTKLENAIVKDLKYVTIYIDQFFDNLRTNLMYDIIDRTISKLNDNGFVDYTSDYKSDRGYSKNFKFETTSLKNIIKQTVDTQVLDQSINSNSPYRD